MEYVTDLRVFLWAVINTWAVYFTGGIIIALLALLHVITEKDLPRKVGFAVAGVFLFLAIFTAWRDEYRKSQPGLHLTIEGAGIGEGTRAGRPLTAAIMLVSLTNRGTPSIADGWQMTLTYAGRGKPVAVQMHYVDPQPSITLEMIHGPVVTISQDDVLYNKTMKEPIATGMKVVGLMVGDIPDLSFFDVYKQGTIIELRCHDVYQNVIRGTWKFTGTPTDYEFVPGLLPMP